MSNPRGPWRPVDHDEGQAGRGELLGHEAAHAAEAAHDEVAAQLFEATLHALSPEDPADLPVRTARMSSAAA